MEENKEPTRKRPSWWLIELAQVLNDPNIVDENVEYQESTRVEMKVNLVLNTSSVCCTQRTPISDSRQLFH